MPLYWECDHFLCVHAGLRPLVPLAEQQADDLLWIRQPFHRQTTGWPKSILFGHTPTQNLHGAAQPWIRGQLIGIDTGCVYGGRLTCLTMGEDGLESTLSCTNEEDGEVVWFFLETAVGSQL